jgi:FHS family glucose/mannose:H+ symporter-like MFS transporter
LHRVLDAATTFATNFFSVNLSLWPLRYAEKSLTRDWDFVFRMVDPHSELSQSSNRKLVLAGQVAFFPTGILQTMLGPMLPILIVRWAMNDTQAGNLFLVQFLASLLGVQLAGVLLARLGFRPAFLSGLLLMAGGVATLYLGSPILGLASVAAYGLGLGLIVPADNLLIAEIGSGTDRSSKASAVSLLNFFWGVGAVFCSLMVAWTAAHKLLPIFLGSVALLLVLLALAMRDLPFPAAAKAAEPSASSSWREIVRSPAIWIFAVIFFLYPGAETAVGGWIGSYVLRLGAHGVEMASVMPAFFYAALTVGRGLGTAFLRYFPERRVLQAGYAAGAAGIGLMLLTSALPAVIGGALITGLSFATLYPITVALFSQRFGVAARSIGAVMFSLASVGPAVIPWMVGVISHATGSLRAGLLLPFAATVILFLLHLFEW